jgi:putative transposase
VSESTTGMTGVMIDPVTGEIIDQKELAERLLTQAKEQGVSLVGPGGLLSQLTRNVLETALEAELTEHLGHEHGQTPIAANTRNGTLSKTVLTEIGPVVIEVPRDRDGSFEPVIVPKRKRRLDGIDQIVLSLSVRGLTTGEIAAHFEEVYGARVSKDTISRITEKVVGELAEWSARPLDPVYPALFVDAIVVKVRHGQVRNTPFYVVMGVTVNGEREIMGDLGRRRRRGRPVLAPGVLGAEEPRRGRRIHRCLRWAEGSAGGDHDHVGANGGAAVHRAPDPQQLPLRRPPAPRRDRQGPQAGLHRPVRAGREGPVRRVHGRVGPAIPGNHPALGVLLGGVRAVPGVRRADQAGGLHDERDRVDQCPLPAAVRARGHFPNEAAALKCLYLVTTYLDPTGGGRARWVMRWKPALNAFAITFAGRFERTTHYENRPDPHTVYRTVPQSREFCERPG